MLNILYRACRKAKAFLKPSIQDKALYEWNLIDGDNSLRLDYDLEPNSVVFDVGGYKGQWASDIYSRYNCRILIFEPVGEFAENIRKRFVRNDKIEVFEVALGGRSRKEHIQLSQDGSSIYRKGNKYQVIEVVDIAEFLLEHKIEKINLMKINIEGGEYEVLSRLIETGFISKIENIQVQFHEVSPSSDKDMETIQKELSKTHVPQYQYKYIWEGWTWRFREDSEG
ncbi:FkbM family methyltransferase [Anaeromusa acidaminophila]|uniref:FkbM family methyltransferase n=1 Tax=Anaeromusa acidaminophila TaxID=81464 RepID=UPI000364D3D4|nr:FkbM family methyltransferase [Anaeromusa acidaminophila]